MKDKIIAKASEMFLKLGFKSITMDDIAGEMCISKKTIYKYFCNKEVLIQESTALVHQQVHALIQSVVAEKHNAIFENFKIKEMFKELFNNSADSSPVYQLKKHYPEIYQRVLEQEVNQCEHWFSENIKKGIAEGLYRPDVDIENYVKFYYILIFHINENTSSESEANRIELKALEYHTRALATEAGIIELEKNLLNTKNK